MTIDLSDSLANDNDGKVDLGATLPRSGVTHNEVPPEYRGARGVRYIVMNDTPVFVDGRNCIVEVID